MTSKDFRIGNKVKVSIFESEKDFKENVKDTYINKEWFIGNIESIEPFNPEYTYSIELDIKGTFANNIENWERVEPIPLTEKIFKNTKFKTLNGRTFQIEYNTTFYVIDIKTGEFSIYFDYSGTIPLTHRKIKYIHELQNLYFALTGEELDFALSEA